MARVSLLFCVSLFICSARSGSAGTSRRPSFFAASHLVWPQITPSLSELFDRRGDPVNRPLGDLPAVSCVGDGPFDRPHAHQ